MWSVSSTWSGTSARASRSRPHCGARASSRVNGPVERGTNTSKRGRSSAAAIAAATSPGDSLRVLPWLVPAASSVSTTAGMTTLISTPEPTSSSRTAAL